MFSLFTIFKHSLYEIFIQVYEYEGNRSRIGSLSSLDSDVTVENQDYDYLNEWGPKFNKVKNIYV